MKYRICSLIALILSASSCGGAEPAVASPSHASSPAASESSEVAESESKAVKKQEAEAPAKSAAPPASASVAPAAQAEPQLPDVVFEQVEPSPAPATIPTVAILSPKKNSVIPAAKAADTVVKFDVKGWELTGGNHVQLIVDNHPYVRIDDLKRGVRLGDLVDARELGPGQHFVAALLARGNGETVKPSGKKVPAAMVSFFVDNKKQVQWKEGSPLLIYSVPRNGPAPKEGLLVDFYVLNTQIKQGNMVVHTSVSGPGLRAGESLSEWKPWRVKNARPGLYVIQVGLFQFEAAEFDSSSTTAIATVSKPAPGRWNTVTGEFTITR